MYNILVTMIKIYRIYDRLLKHIYILLNFMPIFVQILSIIIAAAFRAFHSSNNCIQIQSICVQFLIDLLNTEKRKRGI